MRDRYYALNERPICAKCRPDYARRIALAEAPGAIWRVGLQGALVALIGAVVLAGVVTLFSPARVVPLVPIGYLIGKRMMKALDGYSARRFQYVAVALTYACFLVGLSLPAAREERRTRERRAAAQIKLQGTVATEAVALREELAQLQATAPVSSADADGDGADDADTNNPAAAAPALKDPSEIGPGLAFVLLLMLPFIAMLQFGLTFSGIGMLSLGYGLYQAWQQTDGQGAHLALKGPFRVGTGPIPAR